MLTVSSPKENKPKPAQLIKSVVPWRYPEEFLKVYQYLFDNDITKKRWAVDQMSVWNTRCHPSLPTAIEASLVITRAIIQDILLTNGATLCQEGDIQLMYSMALIRFVNLTIEIFRPTDKKHSAAIAQNLGIATWIVDLRNDASHSVAPSLPSLRLGALESMKYLHEIFWKVEAERLNSLIKTPPRIDSIKEELNCYQILQCKILSRKDKEAAEHISEIKAFKKCLKKIDDMFCRNRIPFLEVLVSENFLIIPETEMKMLLLPKELSDLLDEDNHINEDDDDEEAVTSKFTLPVSLERLWTPLLYKLNIRDALTELVEALLQTQKREEKAKEKLVTAWVMKLLRLSINPYLEKSPLSNIFKKRCPLFSWERLFNAALLTPSQYTAYIFPMIACHLNIEEKALQKRLHLLAISQGQAVDPNRAHRQRCAFTLEKLKKDKKRQEIEIKKRKNGHDSADKNIWSAAPANIDWKSVPIGHVFNFAQEESDATEDVNQIDLTEKIDYQEEFIMGNNNIDDIDPIVEEDTNEADKQTLKRRKGFWFMK